MIMYWIVLKYRISAIICSDSFIIVGYADADKKGRKGTYIIPIDDILSLPQQTHSLSSTDKDNTKWHQLATGIQL